MPLDAMPKPIEATQQTPTLTGPSAKFAKLTIELCELIKRETKLLNDRLPREAQRLHGTKNRLMAEYRETMNHLQVNEKLLGPKNSPVRTYIRDLTDSLREAIRDHARIKVSAKKLSRTTGPCFLTAKMLPSVNPRAHAQHPCSLIR